MTYWFSAYLCPHITVLSSSASISQMKNYSNISMRLAFLINGFGLPF